jgi:20S proteasome subunit alpha 3
VEYAIEHINQDASVIGVLAKDGKLKRLTKYSLCYQKTHVSLGVVLAAEKKEVSKLFVPTRESGKLYKIDDHILASVSGVVADANFLIDYSRLQCQRHLYSHKEPIYIEEIVKYLCNYKHTYTQFGSSRPFGVSFMYAGYDDVRGFQLYNSDPSGNFGSWKAHATGKGSVNAISQLKSDYQKDCSLKEALILAVKVLQKSMDTATPSAEKFEIGVVTKDEYGNVVQRRIEGDELNKILDEAKVFEVKK